MFFSAGIGRFARARVAAFITRPPTPPPPPPDSWAGKRC